MQFVCRCIDALAVELPEQLPIKLHITETLSFVSLVESPYLNVKSAVHRSTFTTH